MTIEDIIREEAEKKQASAKIKEAERANAMENKRRFEETVALRLRALESIVVTFNEAAKARGVQVWQNTDYLKSLDERFKGTTLKVMPPGAEPEVVIITCCHSQCGEYIVYGVEVIQHKLTWLTRKETLGIGRAYERCENSERLLRFLAARYLV